MCLSVFWKLLRSTKQQSFGKNKSEIPSNPPAVSSGCSGNIRLSARKQSPSLLQAAWQESCLNIFQQLLVWATTCWKRDQLVKILKVATNMMKSSWGSQEMGEGVQIHFPSAPTFLSVSCLVTILAARIQRPAWEELAMWLWFRMPQCVSQVALLSGPQQLPTEDIRALNTGSHSGLLLELLNLLVPSEGRSYCYLLWGVDFYFVKIWMKRKKHSLTFK